MIGLSLPLVAAQPARKTPWTGSHIVGSPEPPPLARIERAFPKLTFSNLTDFAFEPTSQRWFVGQLDGRFLSFPNRSDVALADSAGDLRAGFPKLSQFLTFAFHPGFATNRLVFLHVSVEEGTNTVARLLKAPLTETTPPRLDTARLVEILRWPAGGHDGCCLRFGPDGMLYVSIGDVGPPEPPDPRRTGQDVTDLLASVLRLDVDHADVGRSYRVPADNPLVNVRGARPEVWAFGFRNPWRMGFGPHGELWVADVGWELWECIHRVTAGYNAGWSLVEGPNPAVRSDVTLGPGPIHKPAAAHPHSEAASITGGIIVRDPALASWLGDFVYGDWETGKIWALRDSPDAKPVELADTAIRVVSFAEGPAREVLLSDHQDQGGLYRLMPNQTDATTNSFPKTLSATGLFADISVQRPVAGVEPYQIAAEMWSDGATAERWVAIPDRGVVQAVWSDDPNNRKWNFPTDSVLVKTYSLQVAGRDGVPALRRIETQLLHFGGEGWAAYSYRWNDAQTDADLVSAKGTNVTLRVVDPKFPDGRAELTWRFASRAECLRCHNPWSGNALAFGFDQLQTLGGDNRDPTASPVGVGGGKAGSELDRLVALGLIALPDRYSREHLVSPGARTAPLEARARSWLHANCAHCHRWGAGGSVASYFNRDLKLEEARLIGQRPSRGEFGLADPAVIVPGHPERSVLWFRINTEGQGHMPHIGSRSVDEAGSSLLADWIESLDATGATAKVVSSSTSAALAALRASQLDSSQRPATIAAARSSTNAFARDLVERFLPPDQRRHVLGAEFDPQLVLGLNGDAAHGRERFHSESGPQCSRCHVCAGAGRNYGPDLTQIARRFDRATLLDHIVNPSKVIAPEFLLHMVETRDGENLAGFVITTSLAGLRLRCETGDERLLERTRITRDDISPVSAMPEGLLAPLTAQEAADLLAYLQETGR